MSDKAEIIRPSRHISRKVRKTGGPNPDVAILQALNAAEGLMDQYQGWAVDDLAALWRQFQAMAHEEDRELAAQEILDMFNMSHEIRGQGGSCPSSKHLGRLCLYSNGGSGSINDLMSIFYSHSMVPGGFEVTS